MRPLNIKGIILINSLAPQPAKVDQVCDKSKNLVDPKPRVFDTKQANLGTLCHIMFFFLHSLWNPEKLLEEKQNLFHRNTVLGIFLHLLSIAISVNWLDFGWKWWVWWKSKNNLEQKTELSEDTTNDKVFTQAELTAGVSLVSSIKASASGQLSLDDHIEVNEQLLIINYQLLQLVFRMRRIPMLS